MKVHDNFLPEYQYLNLLDHMSSVSWSYGPISDQTPFDTSKKFQMLPDNIKTGDKFVDMYNQQFVYNAHFSEDFFGSQPKSDIDPFMGLLNKLKPLAVLRIKVNLQLITHEIIESSYHIDYPIIPDNVKMLTCVYYLNTNNGYTRFENGPKVDSVANRMVIFDHKRRHAGSTCTDQRNRLVVNINFIPSKDTDPELWNTSSQTETL